MFPNGVENPEFGDAVKVQSFTAHHLPKTYETSFGLTSVGPIAIFRFGIGSVRVGIESVRVGTI